MLLCQVLGGAGKRGRRRRELTEEDVMVGDHHDSRIQIGFCPWVSTPRHCHNHCACHRIS